MITSLKSNKKLLKAVLALVLVLVLAVAVVVAMYMTRPYAVYADGTKVEDPYVVKAGDKELFLVKDAETAKEIVATVINEYSPDGAQINSIVVDKKISSETKDLKRGEEPPVVLTEEEAVNYVLEQNATEKPLFSVTINAELGEVEEIAPSTTYKETGDLYKGENKVAAEGAAGDQIVTNEVTSVNGAVITSEVVDTAVLNEGSEKVIYKGTKDKPRAAARASYGGKAVGSGDGATVANYALQFVGNPYKYGGTSLTNGADCSGFVQSIYAKFGISLPRTADAQAACGKGVSLSEAKAGDLVYYSGHIAIYIGGGRIVHASTPSKGICVSSVHSSGTILAVRRIVE